MVFGMPLWFLLAASTSIMWAVGYVVDEQLMKRGVSPAFIMLSHALIVLPLYLTAVHYLSSWRSDMSILLSSKTLIIYLVVGSIAILGGNLAILYAVQMKNATLASVIEIAYPFFIVLFSWLFFKDVQINWWTAVGAVFIFIGTSIILWKN